MLDVLHIVRGAVSTKDLVPVLTHVALHDGRMCGYNGRLYIDAPAPGFEKLSFTVPAERFIAAIEACGTEAPRIKVVDGRCVIVTRNSKVVLPTGPIENFPHVDMDESKRVRLKNQFIASLGLLRPFVGDDASRAWASGVLVANGRMTATNNVSIVELGPLGPPTRSYTLPAFTIDELTRIGLDPGYMTILENAVTFHLPGDVWIRSKLIAEPWPESAPGMIDEFHKDAHFTPIPPALREAVERIRPFCADAKAPIVQLLDRKVLTTGGEMSAEVTGFKSSFGECAFRAEPLLDVLAVASHIDWTKFPRVPWRNDDGSIRGVTVGVKL